MTHNEKVNYLLNIMSKDYVMVDDIITSFGVENLKAKLRQCNNKQDIQNLYGMLV